MGHVVGNCRLPDPYSSWFTELVRRILPIALGTAVLVAAFAGVASARLATDTPPGPAPAPFRAPAAQPLEDAAQPGSYGFRTSQSIASDFQSAPTEPQPASTGTSATVTITATVLPVVTIVVDEAGEVVELFTNADSRNARNVMYLVRRGAIDGDRVVLDAATWASARAALANAHEGTGTIWSR